MKLNNSVALSLFAFVIVFSTIEAKKKKNKDEDPLERKPSDIDPELWCDSCNAILMEAMKELRGKKAESDVLTYMTNVCDQEKYNIYHYPPPDMRAGCIAFYGAWGEEIVEVLTNRLNDKVPIQKLCFEKTKACENIDWENFKNIDDTIMIDGRPVKVGKDENGDTKRPKIDVNDL